MVYCLVLAMLASQVAPVELPRAPSAWDPDLMQSLPPEDDQGLEGLPQHITVEAAADYSFGTAVGPDGSIWFTEFKGTLGRLSPGGEVAVRRFPQGGAYGVAVDREGTVFVAFDSDRNDGYVLRIRPDGEETRIVEGLTRPRQLACDAEGNVYLVIESERCIRRWNRADATVETVLDGLKCPQGVAVGGDGSIYFSEYGVFGARGVALEPGSVHVLRPDGTVSVLASGIWRARGLALAADGDLYATGEANAWDQGNSGVLCRIRPGGGMERIAQGLDYPQVPAIGPDGKVYFGSCRDNLVLGWDPAVVFEANPWPGQPGIEVGVDGGTWSPANDGSGAGNLRLAVGDIVLAGRAQAVATGRPLRVWVRIPSDRLNLDRRQLPYPSSESHLPGLYRLPSVDCPGARQLTVVPARSHVRARWPVRYNEAGTEISAEGFDEAPEAYLVHLEYSVPDTGENDD